jgi:hypothetical protein
LPYEDGELFSVMLHVSALRGIIPEDSNTANNQRRVLDLEEGHEHPRGWASEREEKS